MRNIPVIVQTDSQILYGTVAVPEGKRLLDLLNERYPGGEASEVSPFLTLNDVTIRHQDGREEEAGTMFVNAKAILMLWTLSFEAARGVAAQTRDFPYVQKLPVAVKIKVRDSELIGNLHCQEKQNIANLLSLRKSFIPCTDVQIRDYQSESGEKVAFVAVNSDMITSVQQRAVPVI